MTSIELLNMKLGNTQSTVTFRVHAGERQYDFNVDVAGVYSSYDELSAQAYRKFQETLADFGSIAERLRVRLESLEASPTV